jgi:hypothetical protein
MPDPRLEGLRRATLDPRLNKLGSAVERFHRPADRKGVLGTLSDLGRGTVQGIGEGFYSMTSGLASLFPQETKPEGLSDLVTGPEPTVAGRVRQWADENRELLSHGTDARGTAGTVGRVGGRVAFEGATVAAGSSATVRGLSAVSKTPQLGRIAVGAKRAAQGLQTLQQGNFARRVAGNVLPAVPIDVLIGAGRAKETGGNPLVEAGKEVLWDVAGSGAFEGIRTGYNAARSRLRAPTIDPTPAGQPDVREADFIFEDAPALPGSAAALPSGQTLALPAPARPAPPPTFDERLAGLQEAVQRTTQGIPTSGGAEHIRHTTIPSTPSQRRTLDLSPVDREANDIALMGDTSARGREAAEATRLVADQRRRALEAVARDEEEFGRAVSSTKTNPSEDLEELQNLVRQALQDQNPSALESLRRAVPEVASQTRTDRMLERAREIEGRIEGEAPRPVTSAATVADDADIAATADRNPLDHIGNPVGQPRELDPALAKKYSKRRTDQWLFEKMAVYQERIARGLQQSSPRVWAGRRDVSGFADADDTIGLNRPTIVSVDGRGVKLEKEATRLNKEVREVLESRGYTTEQLDEIESHYTREAWNPPKASEPAAVDPDDLPESLRPAVGDDVVRSARTPATDLFGERVPDERPAQESMFGSKAGTTESRSTRGADAAARSRLDELTQRERFEKDPERLREIAAEKAQLMKQVNRDQAISAEEMATRARAEAEPTKPDVAEFKRFIERQLAKPDLDPSVRADYEGELARLRRVEAEGRPIDPEEVTAPAPGRHIRAHDEGLAFMEGDKVVGVLRNADVAKLPDDMARIYADQWTTEGRRPPNLHRPKLKLSSKTKTLDISEPGNARLVKTDAELDEIEANVAEARRKFFDELDETDIGASADDPYGVRYAERQRAKAEAKAKTEPVVTRAKDFAESGEYHVQIGDQVARIFRDTETKYWYRVGTGHHTENFLGFTKKEAIETLKADIERTAKPKGKPPSKNVFSPAGAGGAALGASYGYATGEDDEDRLQRAITFGLGGAAAGHLAGKGVSKLRGTRPAEYMADAFRRLGMSQRPDVQGGRLLSRVGSVVSGLFDDLAPVRKLGERLGNTNIGKAASLTRGWAGFADQIIGYRKGGNAIKPGAPTLREVAKEAKKAGLSDVVTFLMSERAIELANNGLGKKGVDLARAQAEVARLGHNAAVVNAARKFQAFYRHLLDLRLDAGQITQEKYNELVRKGAHYIPFVREFGDQVKQAPRGGGTVSNSGGGLRSMDDSEVEGLLIKDPFEQAIVDAQRTARDVLRQRAFNLISSAVDANPNAASPFIQEVGTHHSHVRAEARAKGEVFEGVNHQGKRTYYRVTDPQLLRSLQGMSPTELSQAEKFLRFFKNTLRAGVTVDLAFAAKNFLRDSGFSVLTSPTAGREILGGAAVGAGVGAANDKDNRLRGALRGAGLGAAGGPLAMHGARVLDAMRHMAKNDELYQRFLAEGGSGAGFFAVRDPSDIRRGLAQLRKDGYDIADLTTVKGWFGEGGLLQKFGGLVEQAPRFARFKQTVKTGKGFTESAYQAREVSVDFSRKGSYRPVQWLSNTTAFFNPKLQGLHKVARELKRPGAWAIGAATMLAPSLALYDINKDDPKYRALSNREKNLGWFIPIGKEENGDTKFLVVPKPFEPGMLFASLPERFAEFLHRNNPKSFGEFMSALQTDDRAHRAAGDLASQGGLTQLVGEVLMPSTALQPLGEIFVNKDLFTNREIENPQLRGKPKLERATEHTSKTAKLVSKGLDKLPGKDPILSPVQVDHLIEGWTGTLGKHARDVVDAGLQATGIDRTPRVQKKLRDLNPLVGREMSGGFSGEEVDRMWTRFKDGEVHYKHAKDLADNGKADEAAAYIRAHRDRIAGYVEAQPRAEQVKKLIDMRQEIVADPTMDPAEKRRRIIILGKLADRIARGELDTKEE